MFGNKKFFNDFFKLILTLTFIVSFSQSSKKGDSKLLERRENSKNSIYLPEFYDLDTKSLNYSPNPEDDKTKFHIYFPREDIVDASFKILKKNKNYPSTLKSKTEIYFCGEKPEDDHGGLTKEWFSIFSSETFSPTYGLFQYSDNDSSTVEINPKSGEFQTDHLLKFELLGIFIGMAVCGRRPLNVHFSIPFLKTMLHRPITMNDVKLADSVFYNTLSWLKDKNLTTEGYKFIAQESTEKDIIPLTKNGQNIDVTQGNKLKYIRLLINYRYIRRVEKQMSAFLTGFRRLIPLKSIQVFTADELQLLIGGKKNINIQFWRSCTTYKNEQCNDSSYKKIIEWFWEAVKKFNLEQKSKLLTYVTGTHRFFMDGVRKFEFKIHCVKTLKIDYLPVAHTCNNQLDLPPYKTYEDLFRKLSKAIELPLYFGLN